MAIYRGEYSTVYVIRSLYVKATETVDDALLLREIRETSRQIDNLCNKKFWPRYETLSFDVPGSRQLDFDDWLISATTLTNGNGDVIAASDYNLIPYNKPPYYALRTKENSNIVWENDSSNNSEGVITLAGLWGFAREHVSGWESTGGTLAAAIATTTATSFTCTTGTVRAGMLLRIAGGNEILYASAVTTAASDTVTVERAQNGSTAATYSLGATIEYWTPGSEIEGLCARAAYGYYKAKNNTTGETVTLDGVTFATPKDIAAYLENELRRVGLLSLA